MELSFVFARKLLSKNKGTRTRACNVTTISQNNAHSFTHNQSLSKGLEKLKKNQVVKFKFQMQIKTVSF